MKITAQAVFFLFAAAIFNAYSLERGDISFYLSFEKGLRPEIAQGDTGITCTAGTPGDVPFDPEGLRGRAVRLNDALSITFSNPSMFSKNEGTISFWLKPVGWKAGSGKNHQFFHAHPDNCGLQIYRFYPGNNWAYIVPSNDPKTWRFIGGSKWWDGWEDGKWQHVAFTFKPGEQAIYFGGKLHERKVTDLFEPEFGKNSGITLQPANEGTAQSFDEIIIFRRALTEQEVQSLAREPRRNPAFLTVPGADGPFLTDGKITDEREWKNPLTLTGWADPVLGTANKDETKVSISREKDNLNILFRYEIPEKFRKQRDIYVGSPLKITVKEADGDIFEDDYAGVYLSPPGSEDVYFFGINGAGAKLDTKNGDPSWNGAWQANQARDDHAWTVEFSIPFSSAGKNASADDAWGINFAHGCRQMDNYESIWYYTSRKQWPLAVMRLDEKAVKAHVTWPGALSEGVFSFRSAVSGREEALFTGTAKAALKSEDRVMFESPGMPFTVKPGSEEDVAAGFSLAGPLCGEAEFSMAGENGDVFLSHSIPFVFSRELSFKVRYYPTTARLEAVIDAGSGNTLEKIDGAVISVCPGGSNEPVLTATAGKFGKMQEEIEMDCGKLPSGAYDVAAEISIAGQKVLMKERLVKEPPPEWLGNKLGCFETVPEPWTPLVIKGRSVSCWGREYSFGAAGLLPEQVRILGKDVLAGPARLSISCGGKTQMVSAGSFRVTERTSMKAAFTGQFAGENLRVSADAWIEFDGFCRNEIKISRSGPERIESVAIEIPIKPEFAKYWSPSEYYPDRLGKSPDEPCASEVRNGMRIGDEERGLQFTYVNAQKQVLIPGEGEYVVRYEFMTPGDAKEGPITITFGLQALPVRPRSPIYRSFRVDDCTFTSFPEKELFNISPLFTEGWSVHWNYHNFWSEEAFDPEYVKKLKEGYTKMWEERKQAHSMYVNVVTSDANTPEYRAYRYEWAGKDAVEPIPYDPATKMKAQYVGINPEVKSYEDFFIWHLDKTVRYLTDNGRFPIHCYFDNTASHRNFMKRVYGVMKSVNPLNQIFVHMSGDNNMYAWAFCDWLIEGEENTSNYFARMAGDPTLPENYTRIIDVPKVASRYSPFAFGDKFFLYQFWGWKNSEPARAHLWALLFIHDGTTWAAGGPANKRALTDLGWDEKVEFIPYWRKDTGITVSSSSQPVAASGWARGEKNLLVMVLNDSGETASCELNVDFDRFGFRGMPVKCRDYGFGGIAYPESFKDPEPEEKTVDKSKPIAIEIGKHSYSLFLFRE